MILWRLCSATEDPALLAGEPPPGLLSRPELALLGRLRSARRRADWLLGRYAAKSLLLDWLALAGRPVAAAALTVLPALSGAPEVHLDGAPLAVTLSLSHRAGRALAALCPGADAPLGADLELVEERAPGFYLDFFTPAEAAAIGCLPADERMRAGTAAWSLKEAALKALRVGLSVDTRRVEVLAPAAAPAHAWGTADLALLLAGAPARATAYLRREDDLVLTLAWLGASAPTLQPCARSAARAQA